MRALATGVLLLAAVTATAHAQNPQTREGFWISFGVGVGSLTCDDCDGSTSGGVAYLRMGGTVSPRLLIGGDVSAWSKTENNTTLSTANVGPILVFYPSPEGGFFLKGGVGFGNVKIERPLYTIEDSGAGVTLGLGWDARVGRGFALTPYIDMTSIALDGGNVSTFGFGLGFTWP